MYIYFCYHSANWFICTIKDSFAHSRNFRRRRIQIFYDTSGLNMVSDADGRFAFFDVLIYHRIPLIVSTPANVIKHGWYRDLSMAIVIERGPFPLSGLNECGRRERWGYFSALNRISAINMTDLEGSWKTRSSTSNFCANHLIFLKQK